MKLDEFKLFEAQIKQLCSGLGRQCNAFLVQAFWRSLSDVDLDDIRDRVGEILRSATRDTKFPRPNELRKAALPEQHGRSAEMDGAFQQGLRHNADTWRELNAKDPQLCEIQYAIARWGRVLAADHPSSPQYAEALRQDQRYRDRLQGLLESRAGSSIGDHGTVKP